MERPPNREWIKTEEIDIKDENACGRITVMSSNLLSERYTTGEPVKGYDGEFFRAGEIHNRPKYSYCL